MRAFSDERVEFLVVGGYAVMFFTAPRFALTVDELVDPETVFQMGVPPNRIDILTDLDAVTFVGAWKTRAQTTYGGVRVSMLGLDALLANKRAVARPMDLVDAENLQRAKENPRIGKTRPARRKRARKKV